MGLHRVHDLKESGQYVGPCMCGGDTEVRTYKGESGAIFYRVVCLVCHSKTAIYNDIEAATSAWKDRMLNLIERERRLNRPISRGDSILALSLTETGKLTSSPGIVVHMPFGNGDLLHVRMTDDNSVIALNTTSPAFFGLVRAALPGDEPKRDKPLNVLETAEKAANEEGF